MQNILRVLSFIIILAWPASLRAQIIEDPTTWEYEVNKKKDSLYELVFRVKLKEHWHIWSLKPGEDITLQPPEFKFDSNPVVKLVGTVKEKGSDKFTGEYAGAEGVVSYFTGRVVYTQQAIISANTVIKGKHRYQVCDEKQCLAPVRKSFTFRITDQDTLKPVDTDALNTTLSPANLYLDETFHTNELP